MPKDASPFNNNGLRQEDTPPLSEQASDPCLLCPPFHCVCMRTTRGCQLSIVVCVCVRVYVCLYPHNHLYTCATPPTTCGYPQTCTQAHTCACTHKHKAQGKPLSGHALLWKPQQWTQPAQAPQSTAAWPAAACGIERDQGLLKRRRCQRQKVSTPSAPSNLTGDRISLTGV